MAKSKRKIRYTGDMDPWFVSIGLMGIVLGVLVLAMSVY